MKAIKWLSILLLLLPAVFSLSKEEARQLFDEVSKSGLAQVVNFKGEITNGKKVGNNPNGYRPVVQMHGMGDFAANPMGMVPLKKHIEQLLDGAYVTNVALGKNAIADSLNTFLMVMEKEVETFADVVQNDTNLKNGFNAIGYSQGNLIIRGYIEKYNNPPVHNWVSVHGPLVGVSSMPRCNYTSSICELFDKFLGDLVYTKLAQNTLAQANYFRNPEKIDEYISGSNFLPHLNNEKEASAAYTKNFESLEKLALVKALGDTMVIPNDSEWFEYFEDGTAPKDNKKWLFKDTPWYSKDMFGLKSLDTAGKISFYNTTGDHLQFSMEELTGWVDTYFKN